MGFPNTFHSGKWKLEFSNLPLITKTDDLKFLDNYVAALVLPDYNIMEYIVSGPNGETERHPISRKNEDLTQLQVDFRVSENFENYMFLFRYMLSIRYCEPDTRRDNRLWKSTIDRLTFKLLDNQNRDTGSIYFTEARIVSLSSLVVDHGNDSEVTFTANFSYREIGYEIVGE